MKKLMCAVILMAFLCLPVVSAQAEVKSKYNVDFYGYVKLDAFFQQGYGVMGNYLAYAAPDNYCGMSGCTNDRQIENKDQDYLGMTARQTRIGFLITGPDNENGLVTRGRIEADFYGSAPSRSASANQDVEEGKGLLTIRRAFVEILGKDWEILAGNEWMVVSPIFPNTNNYLYGAELGNLGHRAPQIRFTGYALDKKLMFQVAAVNKMGDVDSLDLDTGRMAASPSWEALVAYKDAFTLGISGHYGMEEIRTTRDGDFGYYGSKVESWSANVHAIVPIGDVASVTGEWFTGANLDGWYAGGQGNGWVVTEEGDREALESTGGWVQVMIAPAKPVKLYLTYGVDDVNDDQLENGTIEPGYFGADANLRVTKNWFYSAMVDYMVSPSTKVSVEWIHLTSEYDLADESATDMDDGEIDRYTLSFWYMF